jgi:predicted Zn-dependent protease
MKTYSVKILEAQDTSARYVSATAATASEAIAKAVDWAQSYRCYGWDGEASTDGLTLRIRKVRAGQTELLAA